jgi:hypothetical protein
MLGLPPWSNWPLHVKIFTLEAVEAWRDAEHAKPDRDFMLPHGFTGSVELEGMDGSKAFENVGSGRTKPIDISDGKPSFACYVFPSIIDRPSCAIDAFTVPHLSAALAISDLPNGLQCTVCDKSICLNNAVSLFILFSY